MEKSLLNKIILALIIFFSLTVCSFALHLKVGAFQNNPLIFKDENGEVKGLGHDIIQEIARIEGWTISYEFDTWTKIYKKLENGEIDILFPVGFTMERAENVIFSSENITSNWGQISLKKGINANSILDLDGKTIAVVKDNIYYSSTTGIANLAKGFNVDINFVLYEGYDEVMQAVKDGKADGCLTSRFFTLIEAPSYGLVTSSILVNPIEVRFGFPKNRAMSDKLAKIVDKHVQRMKHEEGSVYQNSYERWLGFVNRPSMMSNFKILITLLIIPALIVTAIVLILRAEVRRKTREITQKNIELQNEIEERIRIEEQLKENQDKYSTLFNTSYNPIAIIAEDGSLSDVNGEMVAQFGYERGELLQMYLEMLVVKEHVPKVEEIINKMHRTKKWSFELDFVKSWGDVFNAEISASRLEISGRTFIQLVIMDVTSRKKASELLNRRQEYLERKVDQEVQKRRQNERLMMQQSKMAAMGQMMSAIAHQWRQPLNTIAIFIQDFEDSYKHGELDAPYVEDLVTQSMKQISFMSKTIDDFKNFFKPDKDEVIFDVCRESAGAVSLLGVQLIRNGIDLVLDFHGKRITYEDFESFDMEYTETSYAKGFPNEFKQVLLNLVQNARDAIIEKMEKEHMRGCIEVSVTESDDMVHVAVTDNGSGIEKEVAERIFEPYFSTKEEGKGTGVGLYMSKIIIEQNMKGRLHFELLDVGTRFIIDLRAQKNHQEKL